MRKFAKEYLGITEVCEILETAPRTVTKWFDTGKLSGCRLPPTGNRKDDGMRRIHRDSLLAFMRTHEIPIPAELRKENVALLASRDSRLGSALSESIEKLHRAESAVKAGWRYVEVKPMLVLADATIGRADALELLADIRETAACVCLLGLCNEDDDRRGDWGLADCDLFRRPFDPALLVARVEALLYPREQAGKKKARAS